MHWTKLMRFRMRKWHFQCLRRIKNPLNMCFYPSNVLHVLCLSLPQRQTYHGYIEHNQQSGVLLNFWSGRLGAAWWRQHWLVHYILQSLVHLRIFSNSSSSDRKVHLYHCNPSLSRQASSQSWWCLLLWEARMLEFLGGILKSFSAFNDISRQTLNSIHDHFAHFLFCSLQNPLISQGCLPDHLLPVSDPINQLINQIFIAPISQAISSLPWWCWHRSLEVCLSHFAVCCRNHPCPHLWLRWLAHTLVQCSYWFIHSTWFLPLLYVVRLPHFLKKSKGHLSLGVCVQTDVGGFRWFQVYVGRIGAFHWQFVQFFSLIHGLNVPSANPQRCGR